ncbi:MAG: hypothetical protein ACLQE9_00205, partial [Roseiarcus sp.]
PPPAPPVMEPLLMMQCVIMPALPLAPTMAPLLTVHAAAPLRPAHAALTPASRRQAAIRTPRGPGVHVKPGALSLFTRQPPLHASRPTPLAPRR